VVTLVVIWVSNDESLAVNESSVAVASSKNPAGPVYVCTHDAAVVPDTTQSSVAINESIDSVTAKVEGPNVAVTRPLPKPQSDESTSEGHPKTTVVFEASDAMRDPTRVC